MDASVLMDRDDRLRDWPKKGQRHRDGDLRVLRLDSAGHRHRGRPRRAGLDDHPAGDRHAVPAAARAAQRLRVLRRRRHRLLRPVRGSTTRPAGAGRAVRRRDERQPASASRSTRSTPTDVAMYQVDRADRRPARRDRGRAGKPLLGASSAAALLGPGMDRRAPSWSRRRSPPAAAEMTALCQGLHDRGEWFVTGEGEVAANEYGTRPAAAGHGDHQGRRRDAQRRLLRHATSRTGSSADGYIQRFKVKRNALLPTGPRSSRTTTAAAGALAGAL